MVICSLDALKRSSKKKETRIRKEIVKVLQQPCYHQYRKNSTGKIGMMKFLALTLYLLARITLALILSSSIILCFQKFSFQGFNLVICNFELPSVFLYALVSLFVFC